MPNYKTTFMVQIVDINGDTAETSYTANFNGTEVFSDLVTLQNEFATLLSAITNGKVIRQRFSVLVDEAQLLVGTTPPNEAEYSKVETGARLQFANAQGSRASLTVPAPILATFNAAGNANTVDPTQAGVAALIAFIKANSFDDGLNALNLYQGGVRVSHHARRRPNRRI